MKLKIVTKKVGITKIPVRGIELPNKIVSMYILTDNNSNFVVLGGLFL